MKNFLSDLSSDPLSSIVQLKASGRRKRSMILLQSPSRFLLQILNDRLLRSHFLSLSLDSTSLLLLDHLIIDSSILNSQDKGVDIDCQTVEFDDVRYHIQVLFSSLYACILHFATCSLNFLNFTLN